MFSKCLRLAYLKNKKTFSKKHAKCVLYLGVKSQGSQGEGGRAAKQARGKGIRSGKLPGWPGLSTAVGWLVMEDGCLHRGHRKHHVWEQSIREGGGVGHKMGQKGRARDLPASFICLLSPLSHWLKFAKSWWDKPEPWRI